MAKYRMYSLVLRQLNPMQKGVQAAHSMMEYAFKFHKKTEFIHWANVDKTIIILDGGTYQELKECRDFLNEIGVPYTVFYEEDLNNLMTSISFVVEDRVWDTETYPSFENCDEKISFPFIDSQYEDTQLQESDSDPNWLIEMGGETNLKLRNFLKSKRLAN